MNKTFINKYKHGIWILAYMIVYMIWFYLIEHRETAHLTMIHMAIDDKIPFIEQFVIPYFCWFFYVSIFVVYFIFTSKEEYYRLFTFLVTGMTVFLLVSTFWPNGHALRPVVFPRDNIFTQMIGQLYARDTSTNIVPSIHVYNSLGIWFAVMRSERLRKHNWVRIGSGIMSAAIICSTVFIKQHSMFDLITGILLGAYVYRIVYVKEYSFFLWKKRDAVSPAVLSNEISE